MRKTKGRTLIALIITIIVMLILVAVTVRILINSGIIGKAQKARSDTESAYEEESRLGDVINIDGKLYAGPQDYVDSEEITDESESEEVPDDFWILSTSNTAYINTKYISFPGNAWTYGGPTSDQPGECQRTKIILPSKINGSTYAYVFLGNVCNLSYIDLTQAPSTAMLGMNTNIGSLKKIMFKSWHQILNTGARKLVI